MKWTKLFVMALTVSSLFAGAFAEELSSCSQEIDALEKSLPQGSAQIRLTIAEARASAATVETLKQKIPLFQ